MRSTSAAEVPPTTASPLTLSILTTMFSRPSNRLSLMVGRSNTADDPSSGISTETDPLKSTVCPARPLKLRLTPTGPETAAEAATVNEARTPSVTPGWTGATVICGLEFVPARSTLTVTVELEPVFRL